MATNIQRTFVMIKPDAVQRGLIGQVISRLEAKGLKLVAARFVRVDRALASRLYEVHQGKQFYNSLVAFITSSPVLAMVWEGKNVIEVVRKLMGKTDPMQAEPGTLRGDFGLDIGMNVIHGSDSPESAEHEIGIFFSPQQIVEYKLDVDRWVTEF